MLGADDFLIVAIPAAALVLIATFLTRARGAGLGRFVGLSLLVLYGISIIALTFFPIPVSTDYREFLAGIDAAPRHNVIPLATLKATASAGPRVLAYQVGGNAVLLAPFSILVAALWPRRSSLRSILVLGFALTLTIEVAQLGFSSLLGVEYKSFDVDDVLLNITGVALGWCIWRGLHRWFGSREWWTDTLRWLQGRQVEHRGGEFVPETDAGSDAEVVAVEGDHGELRARPSSSGNPTGSKPSTSGSA